MALIPYTQEKIVPQSQAILADINQHTIVAKSMLTALGDYWTNYYRNLEPFSAAMTGSVVVMSKVYTRFLDMIRSANILNVPISQSSQFELLVFDQLNFTPVYDNNGEIDYYFVPCSGLIDVNYLCSTLFEAPVVLVKNVHFSIEKGQGFRFYVDVFADHNIADYSYELGEDSTRKILFWACDLALNSVLIYNRYGRFLYKKANDSEQYKWFVSALMYFYENTKSIKAMERVLNIMYGVPYTRYDQEKILDIFYVDENLQPISEQTEEPFICIKTDKAEYFTYCFSEITVKVGDIVPQFTVLATFNKVEDYITNPKWWEELQFPEALLSTVGASENLPKPILFNIIDKVLKYNLVHIRLGVSYETYQTYLSQIQQFLEIIEGGFPVYLNVLVDIIFRIVFIEYLEIEDNLFHILAQLPKMATTYYWAADHNFDGTVCYYSEPDRDHGSQAVCQQYNYNGALNYDGIPKYGKTCANVLKFDGQADYNSAVALDHGNKQEKLVIIQLKILAQDQYPWEETKQYYEYVGVQYNGRVVASGQQTFGQDILTSNDQLTFTVHPSNAQDHLPATEKISPIKTSIANTDVLYALRFNGQYFYDGSMPLDDPGIQENFTVYVTSVTGQRQKFLA